VAADSHVFALELSSQGVPVALLEQLAGTVLRHTGCSAVPAAELQAALTRATAGDTYGGARRCDLQLRANGGRLEILVSTNGGRVWQTSCAIP
jgi:hypothetical protein